jgi:hypothetical protein
MRIKRDTLCVGAVVDTEGDAGTPETFFGRPEDFDPEMFLIARGWGGLPYGGRGPHFGHHGPDAKPRMAPDPG